ncbi:MAG: hypothetical protein LBV69_12175 [Bacteroidales bacterium]|jgi:DNA mismatch repair ATPase MutS|nr:hypothetical protein [Bacteroidales bacterium]
MKQFKKYINEILGLKFIYENLEIQSSAGRKFLLNQEFINDKNLLLHEIKNLQSTISFIENLDNKKIHEIQNLLSQINDIQITISNLKNNNVLDDIEFFEIKKFSIISNQIFEILTQNKYNTLIINNLNSAVKLLDPENTKIISFYIYSKYNSELESLRKKINSLGTTENDEIVSLKLKSVAIEDEIRQKLSLELQSFTIQIQENINQLAYFDLLLAKAVFTIKNHFTLPLINEKTTKIIRMWNPLIDNILEEKNKKFQKIDLEFANEPVLITGANMSGKTVILKTVSLIQLLFQFGFSIPAEQAYLQLFDEIFINIGDSQSEINGLSSFAIEILNINEIIKTVRNKYKVFALIDELARTTNPNEGKAIVKSFIEIMKKFHVSSLITTHYNIEYENIKKLRVKGLMIDNQKDVCLENINDYMDYSLIKADKNDVPNDALKIAEILQIDREFIEKAEFFLGNES